MAVGIRLRFSGGNQDQYEMVHAYVGFAGNPPEGLIFHVGGPIYGGWGVQEVWVSYEAFDRFVAGRLQPALQALGGRGLPNPLEVDEFPVHRIINP
jgi:hypothetical protein